MRNTVRWLCVDLGQGDLVGFQFSDQLFGLSEIQLGVDGTIGGLHQQRLEWCERLEVGKTRFCANQNQERHI